jgi:hypothetical protein
MAKKLEGVYEDGGKDFRLAYHTKEKWADKKKAQLISLGCSEEYAENAVKRYRDAKLKDDE